MTERQNLPRASSTPDHDARSASEAPLIPEPRSPRDAVLNLQRTAGNHAVTGLLARQGPHTATPPDPTATPGAASRPSRSDLITIANGAINAEYAGAASDGLRDFESTIGTSSDFGPILTSMVGNVIWAAGCFATGGAAFLAGLAGVGAGVVAPATSGRVDANTFHVFANDQRDALIMTLLGQVNRVAGEIDAEAAAQGWDENATRLALLQRLFKPEYISAAGGLPIVNRRAIAHRIQMDLLIKANTYGPSLLQPGGGGQFIYDYDVSNYSVTSGFFIFTSESLKPVAEWRFARRGTQLWIPQGEGAALDVFRREPTIQPADLPFTKSVYINFSTSGGLDIQLDSSNNVTSARGVGVFEHFDDPPPAPGSRSPPPPRDPVGHARSIVQAMWPGGRPPSVAGAELTQAIFPGRSRATR